MVLKHFIHKNYNIKVLSHLCEYVMYWEAGI